MQEIRIDRKNFEKWSDQIEELFNNSFRINFPDALFDNSYGRNKCRDLARYLEDCTAIVFAATEGNKLAGWVWCHEICRVNGRRIHIAEIAVAEEWRRQGVGGRLLERVELYAAQNGYEEIDLLVTASNACAVQFYNKAGFNSERYLMKKTINTNFHGWENIDA